MIHKKELLKKSKLTKKELKAAGIANVERYSYRKPKWFEFFIIFFLNVPLQTIDGVSVSLELDL